MEKVISKHLTKHCISNKRAMEIQQNWINTRAKAIKDTLGFEDTRNFIWSAEALKEYLEHVIEESNKQGISDPGIRVNFAAYNENEGDKATVFFSPTIGANATAHSNYKIECFNFGLGEWPPMDFGD